MRITVHGNLISDPALRHTQKGDPVCNIGIVFNDRVFDEKTKTWIDRDPTFFQATAWGALAENIANSLSKGDRVLVEGVMRTRKYTDKTGGERSSLDLNVLAVGVSLQWATARPVKAVKQNQQAQSNGWQEPPVQNNNVWQEDTPPF